jgi:hypothetical protein
MGRMGRDEYDFENTKEQDSPDRRERQESSR